MRRLFPPDFELNVTKDHLPAFGQIVNLGTFPPRLADTGIQVIVVIFHRPAVRAAADAVPYRLRIIAVERLNIKKAVRHDHPEPFVVVVVRMGQQKVQVLIVMLLEIFDKCRGRRSSVKAVDDERVAGIAVDDQPVSVTLVGLTCFKPWYKHCDSHASSPLKSSESQRALPSLRQTSAFRIRSAPPQWCICQQDISSLLQQKQTHSA